MELNIQGLAKMCIDMQVTKPSLPKEPEESATIKNYVVKQNPNRSSVEIIPVTQHMVQSGEHIMDQIEIQTALEITTLNLNFKLTRLIAMSLHDVYRIAGLVGEVANPETNVKSLKFDDHIWKFDIFTRDFKEITRLPMCVCDEQSQRRLMPTGNHSLVKVESHGFLIIGGSWRQTSNSQALFSRDVFFYSFGSESLKLVAQLHQPKDTVTAVILHQSLYVLGGRVYSSRQVRGQEEMSKIIERIDLSQLLEAGIPQTYAEYYDNQEFIEGNNSLLKSEVVSFAEGVEVPTIPMLCSAISDERTNSIQIVGGRIQNQMSNRAFRFYFTTTPNSNFIRMVDQDQDLNDACCFIDNSVLFRRSEGRKVSCQIGISRQLHVVLLEMRTTQGIEIEKHISYYHKLKQNAEGSSQSMCSQNSRTPSVQSSHAH